MRNQLLKVTVLSAASAVLLAMNTPVAYGANVILAEEYIGGFQNSIASQRTIETDEIESYSSNTIIPNIENLGIANVDTHLNIRKKAGKGNTIIGTLSKNAGCTILSIDEDGWAKIKSGKVTGYVDSAYLITGDEANVMMQELKKLVATTNTAGVNVRSKASTDSSIITQLQSGEEFLVADDIVTNYEEDNNKWVKIVLDGDKDNYGYIAKQYVNISWELEKAVAVSEKSLNGVSSVRSTLVNNAKKYIGGKYVYGGTSLTTGIDCSAFVRAIYRMSGYSLTRTSREQAKGGTTISASNIKPGDLVFYGNNSTGYISHVAMYIGNGQIVHASNARSGIKISNMYYRTPIKCVRYVKD